MRTRSGASRGAAAAIAAVRETLGAEPDGCPWSAYRDPQVQTILRDHAYYESGQVREAWGADPAEWRVYGLDVFRRALDSARADVLDTERAERERGRA